MYSSIPSKVILQLKMSSDIGKLHKFPLLRVEKIFVLFSTFTNKFTSASHLQPYASILAKKGGSHINLQTTSSGEKQFRSLCLSVASLEFQYLQTNRWCQNKLNELFQLSFPYHPQYLHCR